MGWYKKGDVNDQSNKEVSAVVNSGVISYHPTHIIMYCFNGWLLATKM